MALPNYWLVCITKACFDVDRRNGFKYQGFKARDASRVRTFQPGDRVVYYLVGLGRFGAIAEITSGYYHDDKVRIWSDQDEIWPSRARSREVLSLDDNRMLNVRELLDDLSFVGNKENWGLYFRGKLHRLDEKDYRLIESRMRQLFQAAQEEE